MSKHFLLNPNIENQDTKIINTSREEAELAHQYAFVRSRSKNQDQILEVDNLIHIEGRVVVKIDLDGKDSWTFENGQKIEYKRRFNNFNQRETQPVNAIVISGEGINKGAEILIHPNAIHDTNRIFDYKDSSDTIGYYSIQHEMCFAWHDGSEWKPLPPYDFALRVFIPYDGVITGIEPKLVKDVLWVTSGEFKNKAVKTLVACDYQIVFQDRNGREGWLIRFRPSGDEKTKREPEAVAILEGVTEKILSGKYLVGYKTSDAKSII